jgi:hypothetical protein
MATKTAGSLATSTLTAVQFWPDPTDLLPADLATVAQGILKDGGYGAPPPAASGSGNKIGTILPGAFVAGGLLYLPGNRSPGAIKVYPGDWVAVDGFGNAFVIPQRAMPKTLTGSVTLASGTNSVTSATDIRTYGWQVGTHVTSSHTPASSVIGSMSPDGKTFTLTDLTGAAANATGSATETMTAGTFTHS